MNLREIIDTIVSSKTRDWHVMSGWVANRRPSFRDPFCVDEAFEGQGNVLRHNAHLYAAAYIPNASITLAWGHDCNDDFKEDWANRFPDSHAVSEYVDVFYNG